MRVKMNRDHCPATLSFCERCFGKFLLHPMGYERRCFEELEDDHNELLTIELHTRGNIVHLELDEHQRELIAREGWAYFVDFSVPMYRENVHR